METRVFMTGGYGCIGSWVARRLVETGREVWIFDLKEDTHRLDLIVDPEQRPRIHFIAGDVSDVDGGPLGRGRVRGDAHPPPGGPADADLPVAADPRGAGQRDRDAGGLRGGTGVEEPGATGRLCQFGGRAWAGRRVEWPARRRGPAGAGDPLRGVQGLQRAQRPRLLAGSRHHQHRPAALDGLRRRSRLRDDQRADQGDQVGGGGPTLSDQLRRTSGSPVRGRRGRYLRAGHRAAVRGGRGVQPERSRGDDRVVRRGTLPGRACRPASSSATATDSSRSPPTWTTPAPGSAGADPDDPPS